MNAQGSYYLHPAVSLWDGSADYLSFIDRKLNYHCSGPCLQALSAAPAAHRTYPQIQDLHVSCPWPTEASVLALNLR